MGEFLFVRLRGGFIRAETIKALDRSVALRLERHFRVFPADGAYRWVHLPRPLHVLALGTRTVPAAGRLVFPALLLVEGLIAFGKRKRFTAVATRKLDIRHTLLKLTCLLIETLQNGVCSSHGDPANPLNVRFSTSRGSGTPFNEHPSIFQKSPLYS
jgi:hypothetical protein